MGDIPERTPGDLRRTGLALKHDREWDYELGRIEAAIEEQDASFVGLQFPEGLKRRGPAVVDDLRQRVTEEVSFAISGEACYGACDLDLDLMRQSDVFVHFGHSPMKESSSVVYVPVFSNVAVEPILKEAVGELKESTIGLVTTAQHMNRFDDMCAFLRARGFEVKTRRGDERLTHEGQVLGCNYASADVDADEILYVGGGTFHPVGLAMDHPDRRILIADPVNNIVKEADPEPFIRQRYGAIHSAMDATSWGVIYCTKVGQGRWELALDIVTDNPDAYLITLNEITPDRLQQFAMDAFVNTGCPRVTTDDGPQFEKPMLTPGEYKIAIGERPLDELSFDTFHGTW